MKNYQTKDYELLNVKKFGKSAQIATLRQAYSPDRLYAWQGRYASPTESWQQSSLQTPDEFKEMVKQALKEQRY